MHYILAEEVVQPMDSFIQNPKQINNGLGRANTSMRCLHRHEVGRIPSPRIPISHALLDILLYGITIILGLHNSCTLLS
jgi:hypothetical protein